MSVEVEQLDVPGRLSRCAGKGNPVELPAKETIEHMHAVGIAAFRVGPEVRMNGQRIGEYFEPNIAVVQSEDGCHVVQAGDGRITFLPELRRPAAQKHLRQFLSTYPKGIRPQIGQTRGNYFSCIRFCCYVFRQKGYRNRNAKFSDMRQKRIGLGFRSCCIESGRSAR